MTRGNAVFEILPVFSRSNMRNASFGVSPGSGAPGFECYPREYLAVADTENLTIIHHESNLKLRNADLPRLVEIRGFEEPHGTRLKQRDIQQV